MDGQGDRARSDQAAKDQARAGVDEPVDLGRGRDRGEEASDPDADRRSRRIGLTLALVQPNAARHKAQ